MQWHMSFCLFDHLSATSTNSGDAFGRSGNTHLSSSRRYNITQTYVTFLQNFTFYYIQPIYITFVFNILTLDWHDS